MQWALEAITCMQWALETLILAYSGHLSPYLHAMGLEALTCMQWALEALTCMQWALEACILAYSGHWRPLPACSGHWRPLPACSGVWRPIPGCSGLLRPLLACSTGGPYLYAVATHDARDRSPEALPACSWHWRPVYLHAVGTGGPYLHAVGTGGPYLHAVATHNACDGSPEALMQSQEQCRVHKRVNVRHVQGNLQLRTIDIAWIIFFGGMCTEDVYFYLVKHIKFKSLLSGITQQISQFKDYHFKGKIGSEWCTCNLLNAS